jgi:hypothetical protein
MSAERVNFLGVGISAIDMGMALETIDVWIEGGDRQYVCVTGVMERRRRTIFLCPPTRRNFAEMRQLASGWILLPPEASRSYPRIEWH